LSAPSCKEANLADAASSVFEMMKPCRKGTVAVTQLEASPLGVVGMAGNVEEWTMEFGSSARRASVALPPSRD
jgi:hypothetical protein